MLRLLNYLKTHDQTGELPLGLAQEIAHAHKSSGVCAETLSLDAAISLYSDLILIMLLIAFFSPSSHTGPTEKIMPLLAASLSKALSSILMNHASYHHHLGCWFVVSLSSDIIASPDWLLRWFLSIVLHHQNRNFFNKIWISS